jgi:hypothetical protein
MELAPGVRERVVENYVLAADLGQSTDPTAICVLRHRHVTYKHHVRGVPVPAPSEHFDVVHLQRLPLGLSYVEQVADVRRLLARPPLAPRCDLIIDATGVGRAVADLFNTAGMRPVQVTITAGNEQTPAGTDRWHVAKGILISTLDARLHTGALRFAAELQEAEAMRDELKDFRRKVSTAGRYSFEARVGKHDDLVLAVALALWMVVGKPKPPVARFGRWHWGAPCTWDDEENEDAERDVELYAPRSRPPEHVALRNKLTGTVQQFHRSDVQEILRASDAIYEPVTEEEGKAA